MLATGQHGHNQTNEKPDGGSIHGSPPCFARPLSILLHWASNV